jgi:hypothetical protein
MKTNTKPGKNTGTTTPKPAEPPAKKGPVSAKSNPKKQAKTPMTPDAIERIEKADRLKPPGKREPYRVKRQGKSVEKNQKKN